MKNNFLKIANRREDTNGAPKNHLRYNKKIAAMSLFLIYCKYASNFNDKVNEFFKKFPCIIESIITFIFYRSNGRKNSFYVTGKDILLTINSQDPTKTNGCANLTNKMAKNYNESVTLSLKSI